MTALLYAALWALWLIGAWMEALLRALAGRER
jgi:hypothetical protein